MRSFPIYILIDSSTFMMGEPINLIKKQISELIINLRLNPYALETVRIAFLTFGNVPKLIKPLTDISEICLDFLINLEFNGIRNLNGAFAILKEDIVNNIRQRIDHSRDFDYRPLILVFIGGDSNGWKDNALKLISTLGAYPKPIDPEGEVRCWEDRENTEDLIKESLCFCSFNEKVISIYSNFGKYNAVIGKDDVYYTTVKNYYFGML